MVCAGSAGIRNCGTFAKRAAIRRTRLIFTAKGDAILGLWHGHQSAAHLARESGVNAAMFSSAAARICSFFLVRTVHICIVIIIYHRVGRLYK